MSERMQTRSCSPAARRTRERAAARAARAVFAALAALSGCAGSEPSGGDRSDAGAWGSDGYSGDSLCTEERDPSGESCDRRHKIGSARALALAREQVPDAPLIRVISSGEQLDVDGFELAWRFDFAELESGDVLTVLTEGETAGPAERSMPETPCGPAAEIALLDSERFVPDAVLRFEAREGTFAGALHLEQDGCLYRPETHFVRLDPSPAASRPHYFVRYWDDGTFIDLVGPCTSMLEFCLDGSR